MLLFSLALICFASAAKQVDFDCPFTTKNGEKCLRDIERWDKGSDINGRPDIITKNGTKSELESVKRCCYELSCLEECGLYREFRHNSLPRGLPNSAYEPIDKYPNFFKGYKLGEIDEYEDLDEGTKMKWQIAMFHYSQALEQWRATKAQYDKLKKLFS